MLFSVCRAEQLAQVRKVEEERPPQRGGGAYSSLKRSSSRGGTLKKFKFVSSDHLDEESFGTFSEPELNNALRSCS